MDASVELIGSRGIEPRSPDPVAEALLSATQEIKSTAKWITAAFAAVGGAVVTGISISNLGDLSGTTQTVAIAAAVVGVLGVLLVIVFAARVLASRVIALREFQRVDEARAFASWYAMHPGPSHRQMLRWVLWRLEEQSWPERRSDESLREFLDWLDRWREEEVKTQRSVLEAESLSGRARDEFEEVKRRWEDISQRDPGSPEAVDVNAAHRKAERKSLEAARALRDAEYALRQAQGEVRVFDRVAETLRVSAQYEYVALRFDTSRVWIVFSAALAAAGMLAFALTAGSAAP